MILLKQVERKHAIKKFCEVLVANIRALDNSAQFGEWAGRAEFKIIASHNHGYLSSSRRKNLRIDKPKVPATH